MKLNGQQLILAILSFFSLPLLLTNVSVGEVLIEDDFEGKIDKGMQDVPAVWTIDKGALSANGGGIRITKRTDFIDFEIYYDFNMQINLWDAEPVVRASDKGNLYMFQIVADPRHQFWNHIQTNNKWNIPDEFKIPDKSKVNPQMGKWYSAKLVVEGNTFELYYGPGKNLKGKGLKKAFTWTDKQNLENDKALGLLGPVNIHSSLVSSMVIGGKNI